MIFRRCCNSFVTLVKRESSRLSSMADFSMTWSDGSLEGERILKLAGPFTLSTVFDFQDAIRTNRAPMVIVDLSDVPYMDSAALGSLMGLHVWCQQHGRHYSLIGGRERLGRVFRVSGVNSILVTHNSLAEAETAFNGKAAQV